MSQEDPHQAGLRTDAVTGEMPELPGEMPSPTAMTSSLARESSDFQKKFDGKVSIVGGIFEKASRARSDDGYRHHPPLRSSCSSSSLSIRLIRASHRARREAQKEAVITISCLKRPMLRGRGRRDPFQVQDIVDSIEKMSVLDLHELVKFPRRGSECRQRRRPSPALRLQALRQKRRARST